MKNLVPILFTIFLLSCAMDEGPFTTVENVPVNPNPIDTSKNDTNTNNDTIPEPTVFSYPISFNTDVKNILKNNCVMMCHNPSHPKLDLRPPVSYAQLLTDGASAPYVDTLNPKSSIIYLHLVGIYTLMPKDGQKLSQGKIDTIYTWINQGALDN